MGAGAHGYAGGYRYSNVLGIRNYVDRMKQRRTARQPPSGGAAAAAEAPVFPLSPAVLGHKAQGTEAESSDFMLMGLRLTREGVTAAEFKRRFGRALHSAYSAQLAKLSNQGLIEWFDAAPPEVDSSAGGTSGGVRLTSRGRLLGNRVFAEFVS
jgi:oxygen-independent coproporphyrinogen-3 oxidase